MSGLTPPMNLVAASRQSAAGWARGKSAARCRDAATRWWLPIIGLAGLVLLAGCGKERKQPAAGGVAAYLCPACKAKFYVEEAVAPEFCPQCKQGGVEGLIAYVCAADGHVTLGVRRSKLIPCEQCGAQTSSFRPPTAAELDAAGAQKKLRADVCRTRG